MKFLSKSEKQTAEFAKRLAKTLRGGLVLGLIGELGAGKTTLVKALVKALGVKQTIQSPTFVLVKIYPINQHPTIKQLAHIDCYRLGKTTNWQELGWQEYLGAPDTLAVVEWADRLAGQLPATTKYLYFYHWAGLPSVALAKGGRLITNKPITPATIKQSAKLKTVKKLRSR